MAGSFFGVPGLVNEEFANLKLAHLEIVDLPMKNRDVP